MLKNIRHGQETKAIHQATIASRPGRAASARLATAKRPVSMIKARGWGDLPALSLAISFGLLLVAFAYTASRAGLGRAEPLFWAGLLAMVMPVAARLASLEATRQERIGLVAVLGLALYLVKVMHSPFAFTFADEAIHLYNVNQVLQNHTLFQENPILAVTPLYPGLEALTAALVALSGLSPFVAGLVVIGAARLVLLLALYHFYEQISLSARVAGVAVLFYMAHSNFVFWSAQFSYESLALPLATLVLFAVARREAANDSPDFVGSTLAALLALLAVVITHHLTSYALVAFLMAASLLYPNRVNASGVKRSPWGLALISLVATATWLVYVASQTIGYLSPVLSGAISSILRMAVGEEPGRQLFRSSAGYVAPLWERVTGLSSVILMLIGLPFGLWQIVKRYRRHAVVLVLTGAALIYFPLLTLRFTRAGWETANRASNFLFVGIAFILALAAIAFWMPRHAGWLARTTFSAYFAVIFMGGVIAGWKPELRLAQPYRVAAGTQTIEPQGVSAAQWAYAHLGTGNRVATDESNARLMLVHGEQFPLSGSKGGIRYMIFSTEAGPSEEEILRATRVRYVVMDRRLISWDNMTGLYFTRTPDGKLSSEDLLEPAALTKFDGLQGIHRIFDSGNIVIYDVGALSGVSSNR